MLRCSWLATLMHEALIVLLWFSGLGLHVAKADDLPTGRKERQHKQRFVRDINDRGYRVGLDLTT
jgi:hypothetical protein